MNAAKVSPSRIAPTSSQTDVGDRSSLDFYLRVGDVDSNERKVSRKVTIP